MSDVRLVFVDIIGLLTFKSTSATRWYINPPVAEVAAVRER